jgi:hypothetical protein
MRTNTQYSRMTKEPSLFEIPNPFDDYQREKKGWYIETQRLEQVIKDLRERIEFITQRQEEQKEFRRELLEYSKQAKIKTRRSFPFSSY